MTTQDYSPGDLVANDLPVSVRLSPLRGRAALAELVCCWTAQGLDLQCCSGFRDYDTQVSVLIRSSEQQAKLLLRLPPPLRATLRHQTGLCIDVTSNTIGLALTTDFFNTAEGAWLDANAWRYWFYIIAIPMVRRALQATPMSPGICGI